MIRVLVLGVLATACVRTSTIECGELTCTASAVCATGDRCVAPSQLDACTGKADAETCSAPGIVNGVCDRSVCVSGGCGNGVVEPASDEICDDGNRISLDGCRSDCKSREQCGDAVFEPVLGELCDDGETNSIMPGAACRPDCTPARCGDLVVDPQETCDDGNMLPGDGCRADCSGRWTLMQVNTFATLRRVWGAAPNDVWAVGPNRIMRWNGTSWYAMSPPIPAEDYWDVWGSGPSDVYVMSRVAVYRYNGTGWSTVTPGTGITWNAIAGRAGNDVWLVGTATSSPYGRTAHWTGTTWITAPADPALPQSLDAVWVTPTGIVYAVDAMGAVRRRTTTTWALEPNASGSLVTGTAASDVTVFGVGGYHFNGTGWLVMKDSTEIEPRGLGSSVGETVVVGVSGSIMSCDGIGCLISPSGTAMNLFGVWSYAPGRAFVVGQQGTILY